MSKLDFPVLAAQDRLPLPGITGHSDLNAVRHLSHLPRGKCLPRRVQSKEKRLIRTSPKKSFENFVFPEYLLYRLDVFSDHAL